MLPKPTLRVYPPTGQWFTIVGIADIVPTTADILTGLFVGRLGPARRPVVGAFVRASAAEAELFAGKRPDPRLP